MIRRSWHEEAIRKDHDRKSFDCGESALNQFLQQHARKNHDLGGAKTFLVVDDADATVLGFHSLSPASIAYSRTPELIRRGLARYDVPAFRLARLAIDLKRKERVWEGSFCSRPVDVACWQPLKLVALLCSLTRKTSGRGVVCGLWSSVSARCTVVPLVAIGNRGVCPAARQEVPLIRVDPPALRKRVTAAAGVANHAEPPFPARISALRALEMSCQLASQ
jgi:hypothetical protein